MRKILLIITLNVLIFADVGNVTIVKGQASLSRDIQRLKIHNGMPLQKRDIVETKDGRLQMLFEDNTVISLGRESRFVIREYLYEPDTEKVIATFRIEKGFVQTITGAIGKISSELFTLETATTKITPHGTIWSVRVDDNSEEYKVIEGKISLAFNDGADRMIEVYAGETLRLRHGTKNSIESFVKNKTVAKISTEKKNNYVARIENNAAVINEEISINEGTTVIDSGDGMMSIIETPENNFHDEIDDDGNNGHGNNPFGFDISNPGQGNEHNVFNPECAIGLDGAGC